MSPEISDSFHFDLARRPRDSATWIPQAFRDSEQFYSGKPSASGLGNPSEIRSPKSVILIHRLVVLLALTVSLYSRAQNWIQWPRSDGGNGHYFALTVYATNWDAAQKQAVSWGGHLATITTAQEQNFINRTFLVGKFERLPLWIGLFDRGGSGTFTQKWRMIFGSPTNRFEWVTGEPLSYTFWKPGEPNNTPPGEYYVTINWEYSDPSRNGQKGNWNDTPLNGTTRYGGSTSGPYFGIVERDTNPSLPARSKFSSYALIIGFGALLVALLAFLRLRSKRRTEVAVPS